MIPGMLLGLIKFMLPAIAQTIAERFQFIENPAVWY
jgi:hypothetical protein